MQFSELTSPSLLDAEPNDTSKPSLSILLQQAFLASPTLLLHYY